MQQNVLLHFGVIFLHFYIKIKLQYEKKICCPALELFHCLPLWKTVLFVSSRAFSLSTPTFSLSIPVDNSEATRKKATKCNKFYLLQNASSTASSISSSSNPDVMSRKNESITWFKRFVRLNKSICCISYTVVKWGHTEGIEREKTSSQKYTVIALDFWRDLFILVFQIWGQIIIGGQFLGHYHPRAVYPQILQAIPAEGNALIFWFFYMQKINAKCPQISDEKKDKFCSFDK